MPTVSRKMGDSKISQKGWYSIGESNDFIDATNPVISREVSYAMSGCIQKCIQDIKNDDLLHLEILRLRQMLEIAAQDIHDLDGSNQAEYLHDLSTRDYYEEMK